MELLMYYLKNQLSRTGTKSLLGVGIALSLIAVSVGINDNLPGILLLFVGVISFFFAFVHHWKEAGQFGTLLAVSAISFPVLVLLHNIFDGLAGHLGPIPVLTQFLTGLSVISFFAAILLAPAGIVIGIFAGLFYLFRRSSKSED